jgi:hypothetical protein
MEEAKYEQEEEGFFGWQIHERSEKIKQQRELVRQNAEAAIDASKQAIAKAMTLQERTQNRIKYISA